MRGRFVEKWELLAAHGMVKHTGVCGLVKHGRPHTRGDGTRPGMCASVSVRGEAQRLRTLVQRGRRRARAVCWWAAFHQFGRPTRASTVDVAVRVLAVPCMRPRPQHVREVRREHVGRCGQSRKIGRRGWACAGASHSSKFPNTVGRADGLAGGVGVRAGTAYFVGLLSQVRRELVTF